MEKVKEAGGRQSVFEVKAKEPTQWDVVMHNDDVTTMDFVVMVLMRIFRKSEDVAESIMMKIHTEGSAVVGRYYRDIAESKRLLTISIARENGFPLKLTLKEAE